MTTAVTIERTKETMRARVLEVVEGAYTEIEKTDGNFAVYEKQNDVSRHAASALMTAMFIIEKEAQLLLEADQTETTAGFALVLLLDAIATIKMTAVLSRARG